MKLLLALTLLLLPPSVLIVQDNYDGTTEQRTCWMDLMSYQSLPSSGHLLYVRCHDSADGIFKDGFEG